ncbi:uncharacterized protein LOC105077222 isoform X3 [Camelus bactrianus]|uniref:Uncharacterized protein LOC105077222 isoform X3 n=1 Tax=Camelus bactrianus TaxID=9837 RepID=A0AC58QQA0_CAMBA
MKKCPSTISGETDPVELKTHLVQMTSSRFKKSFKSVQNQGLFVFNIKLLTPSGMYIDYNLRASFFKGHSEKEFSRNEDKNLDTGSIRYTKWNR